MPEIGEIKSAGEIKKTGTSRYIWLACPECSVERWVSYRFYKKGKYKERGMCRSCALSRETPGWTNKLGYREVPLKKTDFFYPMANSKGYVREHRLIMAKDLGRCLHPWESVHHKNGIKDDNRLENLELTAEADHYHLRYRGSMITCPLCKNTFKASLKVFH